MQTNFNAKSQRYKGAKANTDLTLISESRSPFSDFSGIFVICLRSPQEAENENPLRLCFLAPLRYDFHRMDTAKPVERHSILDIAIRIPRSSGCGFGGQPGI